MSEPLSVREAETPDSADIPANAHLWRSLAKARRDLDTIPHERQREIALWLRTNNGLAKRYEEIVTDFTVGKNPHPKSEHEKLQAVLDDFWDDPVNNMRGFARELAGQLGTLGEQFPTVHVKESDGQLRLGYLDPMDVESVVCNPGNARDLVEVHLKNTPGEPRRIFRIIRPNEPLEDIYTGIGKGLRPRDPELQKAGSSRGATSSMYDGACFFFHVNKLSNQTRGLSDLFAEARHLDGLDETVMNVLERSSIANNCYLDVEVDSSDPKVLKEQQDVAMAAFRKPLGVHTHNKSVTTEVRAADLKAADMKELVLIVKLSIFGAWGFPLHWFADGGEANLATAGEMGGPTTRKLESRQEIVSQMLRCLCTMAVNLKKALAPETLSGLTDEQLMEFELILPAITSKDTAREAAALFQVTNSIAAAVDMEFLTRKSAGLLWQEQTAQATGFEFRDEDRELLDALDEEETDEVEDRVADDGEEPEMPPEFMQPEDDDEVMEEEAA